MHQKISTLQTFCGLLLMTALLFFSGVPAQSEKSHLRSAEPELPSIVIREPFPGTIYPPDIAAPYFAWDDPARPAQWLLRFRTGTRDLFQILLQISAWIPTPETWETLKKLAGNGKITLTVSGLGGIDGGKSLSRGQVSFGFSKDSLDARIMFMSKPIPFRRALQNPEETELLSGDIGSYDSPRSILSRPPVCTNCHAYSAEGDHLTLDTDFKGDKGGFLLSPLRGAITIDEGTVHSWNDIPPIEPSSYHMGLFARLSPNGRYLAGTVGETSVFVMLDELYFSQLFFPATGRIAIFDTYTEQFHLPAAATGEDMVQTAPAWSPDGRTIAFSTARLNPDLIGKVLDKTVFHESPKQTIFHLNAKYPVQFDIYTLPLDHEATAKEPARPLPGASRNGYSNYFPRYSPNGKWLVFTRSPTGLVLQPDSELCIVPAAGGNPRVLKSNQPVMNSWHAWSPNSRWLIFTCKANSPFTELYLTHINELGEASPAIRLFRFSRNDRAAMVPEFIPGRACLPESITFVPGAQGKGMKMSIDGR